MESLAHGFESELQMLDEIKRLRAELAVFKDGMPSSDILHRMASEFPVCEQQQWLRRIAEKVGE